MFSPDAVFEKCEKFNGIRSARYTRAGIFVSVNTNNGKIITDKLREKLPTYLRSYVSLLTFFIGTMIFPSGDAPVLSLFPSLSLYTASLRSRDDGKSNTVSPRAIRHRILTFRFIVSGFVSPVPFPVK